MFRACLAVMIFCAADQVKADAGQPGQRADLQVGGPLRAVPEDSGDGLAGLATRGESNQFLRPPADGASSSLIQVLNTEGFRPVDLDREEDRNSGLIYSVTRSLSLGFRYHLVAAEDLVTDLAAVGALDDDYQSHHILFRAKWRFQ